MPTKPKFKLTANETIEIHPYMARPTPVQALDFDVPADATRSGILTLRWSLEPGTAGFASSVAVAEVMLMRK
jgi:hypothetical protein